jgi:hypothetical protein
MSHLFFIASVHNILYHPISVSQATAFLEVLSPECFMHFLSLLSMLQVWPVVILLSVNRDNARSSV